MREGRSSARGKDVSRVDLVAEVEAIAAAEAPDGEALGRVVQKIAEGKSRKEALRCLKRRISDAVFKSLMADLQAPSRSAA